MTNERIMGDRWFHGKITGDEASALLLKSSKRDGIFFVRESTNTQNSYVLCVWAEGQPHQFKVNTTIEGQYCIERGPCFPGVDVMIDYYRQQPDGLPTLLTAHIIGSLPPPQVKQKFDTPLHISVKEDNQMQVSKLLLTSSSDLNNQNEVGFTALHQAVFQGSIQICQLLIQARCDPTLRDRKGCTPLHIAAQRGLPEICEILVKYAGISIQERNSISGWVALHEAVFHGNHHVVDVLLRLGAPLRPRTPEGDTPRALAEHYNKTEVIKVIRNYESKVVPSYTTPVDWLHTGLSRQIANNLLENNGMKDGLFLVRPNSKRAGYYALSLAEGNVPYHFVIVSLRDQWFYIDDGPMFETLEHIIEHYMRFSDGLPTCLKTPVRPQSHLPTSSTSRFLPNPSTYIKPVAKTSQNHQPRLPPRPPSTRLPFSKYDEGEFSHISAWLEDEKTHVDQIAKEDIVIGCEIGNGEFGEVYKGTLREANGTTRPVAIKTLRQECINTGWQAFLTEAKVMFDLKHTCIVLLIGVCVDEPLMLVQELITGGSLLNFILLPENYKKVEIDTLKLWSAEIAFGMMYLESRRFVHRDLAARNILIASMTQVKISDFGLSRAVGSDSDYYKASKGGRWPVKWYAPESVYYGTFSHSSDVWSYGVTLWEMFSFGEQPYGEMAGPEVLAQIEKGKRLTKPELCPNGTYDVMTSCWHYEPKKRPTFKELHTCFASNPEYMSIPHADLYASHKELHQLNKRT